MDKKEAIQNLGERKKMFEDYLKFVRQPPRQQVNKDRQAAAGTSKKAGYRNNLIT